MPIPNSNHETALTPEGLLIKALPLPDLLALSARCEAYVAECERRGRQATPEKATMCEAVYYHIALLSQEPQAEPAHTGDAIADAFAEFSLLRRQLIALGYTTPPISGTPTARTIRAVCDVLREAIKAHTPLPGEPADVTQRIRNASREAVTEAIAEINAGRDVPRPF